MQPLRSRQPVERSAGTVTALIDAVPPVQPLPAAGRLRAANEATSASGATRHRLSCAHPVLDRQRRTMQRILIVLLLFLIVLLQLRYRGAEGQVKVRELEQAIATQAEENEQLRARNAALEAEVVNLKDGLEAIEERARAELGLIAEDEVFYRVIGEPETDTPTPERRR